MVKNTTISNKQITKHGFCFAEITPYGLACGYVQKVENKSETRRLTLRKEANVYHVVYSDTERIPRESNGNHYVNWATFETLKEARQAFNSFLSTMATYYDVIGNYDGKWEVVTCEPCLLMALDTAKAYRLNEPGVAFGVRRIKDND